MDNYKKYLKYKKKYNNLKFQIGGQINNLLYIGMNKYFRNNKIDEIKESLCINDSDIQKGIEYENLIEFNNDSIDKKFNVIFITYTNTKIENVILIKLLDVISDDGKIYFYNLDEMQITHIRSIFKDKQYNFYFINSEQIIGISPELTVIYKYFNPKNILQDDNTYEIICNDNHNSKFEINDYIDLDKLNNCGTTTGTSILERIILIAKELDKKMINLEDASFVNYDIIECSYSLAYFYILLTGESWYNKFMFRSGSHDEDKAHNDIIRHLSLQDFISRIKEKYNKTELSYIIKENNELLKIEKDYKIVKEENPNVTDTHIKRILRMNYDEDEDDDDTFRINLYYDKYIIIKNKYGSIGNYKIIREDEVMKHEILNINEFIETYKEIMPEIDECTPVNLIIKKIYDQIKLQHIKSDHKIILLLSKLIKYCDYILNYNQFLSLIL
jgi:hypothetical protein